MARENAIASTSTSRTNFRLQSTRSHPVDQSVAADAMEDVEQDEEEEEGEVHTIDDDLDGLSIQTFVEVPVMGTPQTFQRLQTHRSSLKKASSDIAQGITGLIDTAVALEDVLGASGSIEHDESFKTLHSLIKSYIDQQKYLDIQIVILKELEDELSEENEKGLTDIQGTFKKKLNERCAVYDGLSDRLKYSKNEHYQSFRTSMWEVNHHTPCPPMSEFLSLKRPDGGEDDDDEEEIEMGGQTMEYKCPITLMPFVDAVKSTKCVHRFSGEAIKEHIRVHRGHQAQCPVPGCGSILMLSDLKPDQALQKRSDNARRRLQIRQDEMEDDAELIE